MTKAIESGLPKQRIEEAAAIKQAKIDTGEEIIVGMNKFVSKDEEVEIELLEVDNSKVLKEQLERLELLKKERNQAEVEISLQKLTEAAQDGSGNLLALAVDAARKRASIGEISLAMEKAFGRYQANINAISGVYSSVAMQDPDFKKACELADTVAEREGRRPRILVAKVGQDGHDRGAKIIATSFADIGFDVDIGPLFQMPKEVVKQAIENDVHVIGISSLAAGHKTLIPEIVDLLKKENREDILVIAGGVIPPKDYQFLKDKGVKGIFGPGTKISAAAIEILNQIKH
jgi:methylmalonyl-CoA mutase